MLAPIWVEAKHISNKVVIKPPLPTSCPAAILPTFIKSCMALNATLKYSASNICGASSPILFNTCAKDEPPSLKVSLDRFRYQIVPPFNLKTGSTILVISLQCPAADIITVPGEITSSFGYFCFIDNESLPVGILIPKAMANAEHASTASYKRASSPSFLQGHIQLADKETLLKPSAKGAQIILLKASPMAFLDPAAASINATIGACPILVAKPSLPL